MRTMVMLVHGSYNHFTIVTSLSTQLALLSHRKPQHQEIRKKSVLYKEGTILAHKWHKHQLSLVYWTVIFTIRFALFPSPSPMSLIELLLIPNSFFSTVVGSAKKSDGYYCLSKENHFLGFC